MLRYFHTPTFSRFPSPFLQLNPLATDPWHSIFTRSHMKCTDTIRILIIEDELVTAANLEEQLHDLGYAVTGITPNSDSALAAFKQDSPDMILSDIRLSGSPKDGLETVEELTRLKKVPVIFLSAFHDVEYRERAKRIDYASYLIKPASKAQIAVSVDMAFNAFVKSQNAPIVPVSAVEGRDTIFLKARDRYVKLYLQDICFAEADGNYIDLYTVSTRYAKVWVNLASLMDQIQFHGWVRCHRSFAVNMRHVYAFEENKLFLNSSIGISEIPFSAENKAEINAFLPKIKTN